MLRQDEPFAGDDQGVLDDVPPELLAETGERTFAVIELAVRAGHRRQGIGRSVLDALLADRSEERAALLVRPEADAAQAAYARWGWHRIGRAALTRMLRCTTQWSCRWRTSEVEQAYSRLTTIDNRFRW